MTGTVMLLIVLWLLLVALAWAFFYGAGSADRHRSFAGTLPRMTIRAPSSRGNRE